MLNVNRLACERTYPTPPLSKGSRPRNISMASVTPKLKCANAKGECTRLGLEDSLQLSSGRCQAHRVHVYDNAWTIAPELYLLPKHKWLIEPFFRALGPPPHRRDGILQVAVHVRGGDAVSQHRDGNKLALKLLPRVFLALERWAKCNGTSLHFTAHTDIPHIQLPLPANSKLVVPHKTHAIAVLRDLAFADILVAGESSLSTLAAWLGYGRAQLQMAPLLGDWHEQGATRDIKPWPPGMVTYEQFLMTKYSCMLQRM
jgi:hypothetical protein